MSFDPKPYPKQHGISEMSAWWAVALLFERMHSDPDVAPSEPLWEESIRLLSADTKEAAEREARKIALDGEMQFKAISGETVVWKLNSLLGVHPIDAPFEHGVEIFSRFLRTPPAVTQKGSGGSELAT